MSPLYHYCSNAAFHAIVSQRTVWLSSLSLSSDSMEGRLVAKILARFAMADNLRTDDALRIEQAVQDLDLFIDGLGFCLSEDGDLLSQWRAYAADASGVSIAFSKDYLEDIAEASRNSDRTGYALHQVEYDPKAQERMLEPTYRQIKQLVEEGALRSPAGTILTRRSDECDGGRP